MRKLKTGITKRLFLYITSLVLGITTLILLSNTLLLRPLYHSAVKSTMLHAVESLSAFDYSQDDDVWSEEVRALTAGKSYDVMILNDTQILWSSSPEFGLMPRPGVQSGISAPPERSGAADGVEGESPESAEQSAGGREGFFGRKGIAGFDFEGGGVYFGTVREPNSDIAMMMCTTTLDNGISIVVTQAIEPINQSVAQANRLLIACALLSLGVAMIVVFKVSKHFTLPIRRIQNTVGEMAALNFGSKCEVATGDELQSLGEDVNRLGGELESALSTLKKQNEQLEKDIAAQRQFISNASHELRTPLALIKGYADEMHAGFASSGEQKDLYIEIIAEEAAKMSRLLKEMLELTRMESGRAQLVSETLSVKERILGFLEKYDGFIQQNGLNISVEASDAHIGVFDAMRFEQVLANYISNAARYGDGQKQVRIATEARGGAIRICVFNTGPHLSREALENIWNSFYKADDARTRAEDSYGLGLSVVKAIQSAAGQRCGVKNVQGGVIFWFEVRRLGE